MFKNNHKLLKAPKNHITDFEYYDDFT